MPAQDSHLLRLFEDAEVDEIQIHEQERTYSDDEIRQLLTKQIAHLLEHKRDWLMGKLYRLDVREPDIKRVLANPDASVAEGLAALVLSRQYERQASKINVEVKPLDPSGEFGDLVW